MTVNLDYSFYNNDALTVAKENIDKVSRSVRTKLGLKDKLVRNYSNTFTEAKPSVEENRRPIDDTKENIEILKPLMDRFLEQGKVTGKVKRIALYTKPFKEKIESTFFGLFPMEEKQNAESNVGIPNTWENVTENDLKNIENENAKPEENSIEIKKTEETPNIGEKPVEQVAETASTELSGEVTPSIPTVETTPAELPIEQSNEITPNIETEKPAEFTATSTELPVAEPKTIENDFELPSLEPASMEMPSLDNMTPVTENSENEIKPNTVDNNINMPSFDFELNKEVEPVMSNEMQSLESTENEIEVPMPSMNVENKDLSVEDKIALLLNRGKTETTEIPEMTPTDKKEPSQADVIARVQKTKNLLKEKDAEIASLKTKIEEITDKYTTTKAKLDGYNAVIRDVTAKYDDTARNNDELSSKYDQLEESLNSKIASLEEQLKETQQSRILESEKTRQTISDMKNEHSKEIEELTRKNNQKLQSLREEKDRQLKEAYSSILSVLSPTEETQQKVA